MLQSIRSPMAHGYLDELGDLRLLTGLLQIDFRKNPELYRIGKGEQGVLLVEPYKSEILPHWKFKTPQAARNSASNIYKMFLDYHSKDDFVGLDMARKFLQMGYTRSRRYANHKSGRKYSGKSKELLPRGRRPRESTIGSHFLSDLAEGESGQKISTVEESTPQAL